MFLLQESPARRSAEHGDAIINLGLWSADEGEGLLRKSLHRHIRQEEGFNMLNRRSAFI